MKSVIAVSGKDGQLGRELQSLSEKHKEYEFLFAGRNELDLCDESSIINFFSNNHFSYFINCAAYTAVDKAEMEKEIAIRINANAVGTIAKLCSKNKIKLIHISTDYVFNGEANKSYEPDDKTQPINYYGYSKLLGEKLAIENCEDAIIIRTSWVYSEYGNNFVKTMVRLMNERNEINVVNDQFGSPTYAKDLAEIILQIIKANVAYPGIYHFSNEGEISWFQFAEAIKKEINSSCKVNGISTSQYPTPAMRPYFSVMNKNKIANVYGIKLKHWQESLKEGLQQLTKQ